MRILTVTLMALVLASCSETAAFLSPEAEATSELAFDREEAHAIQLPASQRQRLLIRTGSARVAVDRVDGALEQLEQLASSAGGYLDAVEFREDDHGGQIGSASVRIPVARFEEFVDQLSEVGTVRDRSTNTDDVTRDYFDLTTRLAVKEAASVRLQSLVAMSADVEELLAVERELARVTAELEVMKGERRYLDDQVSMATLSITLIEPPETARPAWSKPITSAFSSSIHVLGTSIGALVYLVVFLIPWALLALLALPLAARLRRRHAHLD